MTTKIDNSILSQLISDHPQPVDWESFSPMDWSPLLRAAQREGVGPLLYWKFSKSGKLGSLPEEVRDALRLMYARTWAQNQKRFDELGDIAPVFHERGIPVVVLKGACFALTIYPDIGLRPMADFDVLVPISRLAEAVEVAKLFGYKDATPEPIPGLNDLVGRHVGLQKTGTGSITLEIHSRLVADKSYIYAVCVDWFWEQTEQLIASPMKKGFEHLLMLTPTAQLLYAASHTMLQHGERNSSLRWYYDVDQLIRASGNRLDWNLLLLQAQKFKWVSALKMVLSRAQEYFGTPVPEMVWFNLSQQMDGLEQIVLRKQIRPATHTLEEYQNLSLLNWHGRIGLIWALLFPGPAYMRWRYRFRDSRKLPFYYLFRWWGIAKDAVRTVAELFKRKSLPRT